MRARPWEVPDGLWERIEPMLPKRQRRFAVRGESRSMTGWCYRGSCLCCIRDRLGASAAGARLRLRHDRVEAATCLAAGGRVVAAARSAVGTWLHNRRRLLIRTDRRDDIHEGFLALACCLICWQRLESLSLAGNPVGAGL